MDLLKSAIASTKKEKSQILANVSNGKKWYRKGDEEAERERKYREEMENERQEREQKKRKFIEEEKSSQNESTMQKKKKIKRDQEEEEDREVQIPKAEVMKTLRSLGQPITLFAETEELRIKRLRSIQANEGEIAKGQQNVFAQALKEREQELLKKSYENKAHENTDNIAEKKILEPKPGDEKLPSPPKNVSEFEYVRYILKRLLKEWEEYLEHQTELEKQSFQGKHAATICKQTKSFLKPLMIQLQKKTLPRDISTPLKDICVALAEREYVKAHDLYLQLSIGNAPWPMGVTNVGIHARSARERIGTDQIAHVLNDEEQRKYIQSVKRLMTFCQTKYPTDPSKMVSM
jgi:pre-mRNA-splicing factor 18